MSNENYINHYIDILSATLNDAILRNVSLQANARISEEVIKSYDEIVGKVNDEKQALINQIEESKDKDSEEVVELKKRIEGLEAENISFRNQEENFNKAKTQVQHLDTFRSELAKARKEKEDICNDYEIKIKDLQDQIDYLQLTPAKRKKVDEAKAASVSQNTVVELVESDDSKDGGSF